MDPFWLGIIGVTLTILLIEAPTTVLAVKDRVTGHNPLGPVYLLGNYYSWLKNP